MDQASCAATSLYAEMVQVGDAVGQRAQRRGLAEGAVGSVGVRASTPTPAGRESDLRTVTTTAPRRHAAALKPGRGRLRNTAVSSRY